MAVTKYLLEPNGKRRASKTMWKVEFRYKDYTGKWQRVHKKGFATMAEAKAWEKEEQEKYSCTLGKMTLKQFVHKYYENCEHEGLKDNTMRNKRYLIMSKVIPYLGERRMVDITKADIIEWQKDVKARDKYADTYLKHINAQLSAIFNHAVAYYDLPYNPCSKVKSMGKDEPSKEKEIWTVDEFNRFLECVRDKPMSYYGFLILYWTGIRIGELLALTPDDFDLEKGVLTISKSCQYLDKKRVITEPKTKNSIREITLPNHLVKELSEYMGKLYGFQGDDYIFDCTKRFFEHEIERGAILAGVKKINLHCLRHSHASLLVSKLNYPVVAVSRRLGHSKVTTTLNTYGHMYPKQEDNLARELDKLM